jgi:arginyl-tRNA synthetase
MNRLEKLESKICEAFCLLEKGEISQTLEVLKKEYIRIKDKHNKVIIFEKEIQKNTHYKFGTVRIIKEDGVFLYVAHDIAVILGYFNSRGVTKPLKNEWKMQRKINLDSNKYIIMTLINKKGLVSAISRTKRLTLESKNEMNDWLIKI